MTPLAETERDDLELKEALDPTVKRDRLQLVKEIVAMANTKGGRILVGVTDAGERVGIPERDRIKWDGARIGDLVESYINPERVEISITFRRDGCPEGTIVVQLAVPYHPEPPLVISKVGTVQQKRILRKGDVLVRNNTKVEPASRRDFHRWREEDRQKVFEGVSAIVLNPGATVQITEGEETRSPPSYLFSRSVDLFRQRPDKLLDAMDLQYMFTHRERLNTDSSDRQRLLIHSALRRQATLWFWLALLNPSTDEVTDILHEALGMKDRDKSDMSRAMALAGSLFLTPLRYDNLISRMETSRYAHIRRAAERFATISSAQAAVSQQRTLSINGRDIARFSDQELLAEADSQIAGGQQRRISRQLPSLGLEYLTRQLAARRSEPASTPKTD